MKNIKQILNKLIIFLPLTFLVFLTFKFDTFAFDPGYVEPTVPITIGSTTYEHYYSWQTINGDVMVHYFNQPTAKFRHIRKRQDGLNVFPEIVSGNTVLADENGNNLTSLWYASGTSATVRKLDFSNGTYYGHSSSRPFGTDWVYMSCSPDPQEFFSSNILEGFAMTYEHPAPVTQPFNTCDDLEAQWTLYENYLFEPQSNVDIPEITNLPDLSQDCSAETGINYYICETTNTIGSWLGEIVVYAVSLFVPPENYLSEQMDIVNDLLTNKFSGINIDSIKDFNISTVSPSPISFNWYGSNVNIFDLTVLETWFPNFRSFTAITLGVWILKYNIDQYHRFFDNQQQ